MSGTAQELHPTHLRLLKTCLDAMNRADTESWVACYTDDARSEDVPLGTVWQGREEIRAGVQRWVAAIPDTRMEAEELVAEERSGHLRWVLSGTLEGGVDGMPPALAALAKGKTFSVRGVTVYDFSADGRIAREVLYWDLAGVLAQFGVLPPL